MIRDDFSPESQILVCPPQISVCRPPAGSVSGKDHPEKRRNAQLRFLWGFRQHASAHNVVIKRRQCLCSTAFLRTEATAGYANMPSSPPCPASPQPSQQRRRLLSSRACDRCRRRKAKCDSSSTSNACSLCLEAEERCTFDVPSARRGPKIRRITGSTVAENRENTAPTVLSPPNGAVGVPSFGSPIGASPSGSWEHGETLHIEHALSPQTIRSSVSDPSGTHRLSAIQRWHGLARSLALINVNINQMVTRCFDLFFEYLYPLTPLVHEPSLREGLVFFLAHSSTSLNSASRSRVDAAPGQPDEAWPDFTHGAPVSLSIIEPWHDSTFTLITAVCAEAAFLLPRDLFAEGESVANIFLQASRGCLNQYLEADLENPNANSIAIRYFHSNCLHAAGKPKYSWHIFGEATRLAQVMQLHEESSLEGLFPIEAELRRRAFWIVYMGDKSAAILNNRPITIHKYSFEAGITTSYPTGIEDESSIGPSPGNEAPSPGSSRRNFIEGFNANLRLWQAASDVLLEARLIHDRENLGMASAPPQALLTNEQRRRLDALYVNFITCLDDLPPYLQSYTFAAIAAGGKETTTQSKQFIIQCANLQVSLHCLKMAIAEKLDLPTCFGTSIEQADLKKTEIARDMLRVMHEAPFWSLQVNGEPYVEKIRLIGASLLAIIHRNQSSPLATRARADFSVLLDILTRLDSKASNLLRSNSTWDVYASKG
ncbi:unnamed protein product [Clonostachys chloroleuca]|uniref:Zn(2)-C6 fungal-type domain-containing protein n=1 Tax=Clonostachys chloroleuca TaxID=1926264 RepID=A0AA35MAH8_9HYPO|nr:unnamed protein product [Clonostachys chloroleuca]